MQSANGLNAGSISWLGFELSVLRRLNFRSVALPLAGEPSLGLNWMVSSKTLMCREIIFAIRLY